MEIGVAERGPISWRTFMLARDAGADIMKDVHAGVYDADIMKDVHAGAGGCRYHEGRSCWRRRVPISWRTFMLAQAGADTMKSVHVGGEKSGGLCSRGAIHKKSGSGEQRRGIYWAHGEVWIARER
jgi:hypothetical protein